MVDEFYQVGLSARYQFFHQFSILKTIFSTLSSAPKFFQEKETKLRSALSSAQSRWLKKEKKNF